MDRSPIKNAGQWHRIIKRALESTTSGVVITDPTLDDNPIIYCNPAFEHITGYSQDEIVGRNCRFLQGPETDQVIRANIHDAIEQNLDFHGIVKNYRRDGTAFWNKLVISPVRNEEREVTHFIGLQVDITDRMTAQSELQSFSRRLIEAIEAERTRIARELHDEVGQVLTGLKFASAQFKRKQCHSADIAADVDVLIDFVMKRVRDISHDLHPSLLDDFGLYPALQNLVNHFMADTHIAVHFRCDEVVQTWRYDPTVELTAYRIVQESLTNIARHSKACVARVDVQFESGKLRVDISDDGVGFDCDAIPTTSRSIGLRGMRERVALLNGCLIIDSSHGQGAKIRAELPIADRQ